MTIVRSLPVPVINATGCTGCGRCVGACPLHLLSLEAKNWVKSAVIHGVEKCTGCGKCKTICPFNAIQMHRNTIAAGSLRENDGQRSLRETF